MLSKNKKWITLLELMIVIGIVWLLSVVLFRTYASISQITFRLQQEKNVMSEVLSVSQILQNISEKSSIDYSRYNDLSSTQWFVDKLSLTWNDWEYSLFVENGVLIMNHAGKTINLTDIDKVVLSGAGFKVIPFADNVSNLEKINPFLHINQPWFWIFLHVYTPFFGPDWVRNVDFQVQQFFSLQE